MCLAVGGVGRHGVLPPVRQDHINLGRVERVSPSQDGLPLLTIHICRPLICLLALRSCIEAQPQRDVGWLHRISYHPYQVIAQRLQVSFVAQLHREPFERLSRVVLPAVEAAVDERLDAMSKRAE